MAFFGIFGGFYQINPSSNLGAAFESSSQLSLRAHAGNGAGRTLAAHGVRINPATPLGHAGCRKARGEASGIKANQ